MNKKEARNMAISLSLDALCSSEEWIERCENLIIEVHNVAVEQASIVARDYLTKKDGYNKAQIQEMVCLSYVIRKRLKVER